MPTGKWGDPSWSNGNVPLTAMTKIVRSGVAYNGPGHGVDGVYLEPSCAIAVNAMLDAYAAQHGGAILPLNEGYRSYGGQVQYWDDYGHNPALAAPPGTSNHGWGEAVDIGVSLGSSQRAWLLANGPTYGFYALSNIDPVHFDYSGSYTGSGPTTPEEDMYDSAAESRLMAKLDSVLTGIRREGRGRLYFDAGNAGTLSEAQATRFVIAKVTDGFIYPLNPDPTARAGQLASLRATPYQIIDAAEVAVGLDSHKFNNLIEQANGHVRRIGAEVIRQQNGGATPAVTPTTVLGAASPTPVLVPQQP